MDVPSEMDRKLFLISSVNPRVVYINRDLFHRIPNTANYIIQMHQRDCGGSVNLSDQNTLALYFDTPVYSFSRVESNYSKILGFLNVKFYSRGQYLFAEIYNVCTDGERRGEGVMKSIMSSLLIDLPREIPNVRIWLGIALNNPNKDMLVEFYVKLGFSSTSVDTITPSGTNPGFPFLSLYYQKSNNAAYEINKAKTTISNYLCSNIPIHISIDLINKIKGQYISGQDEEYGGLIGLRKNRNNVYEADIHKIIRGTRDETPIPFYYITWHTHPNFCYRTKLCFIGWPSGQDMVMAFRRYQEGQIGHFLFAAEGIYFTALNPNMMRLYKNMSDNCRNTIEMVISFVFGSMESKRSVLDDPTELQRRLECLQRYNNIDCYTYHTNNQERTITEMVTFINTTSLQSIYNMGIPYTNQLLQNVYNELQQAIDLSGIQLDVPIFITRFRYYKDIDSEGLTIGDVKYFMPPNNSVCPLPDYTAHFAF